MKLFTCRRYGCRMTPYACAARQARVREESFESEMSDSLAPCLDCVQGRKMAAGIAVPERNWRPHIVIGKASQQRQIARRVMGDLMDLGLVTP